MPQTRQEIYRLGESHIYQKYKYRMPRSGMSTNSTQTVGTYYAFGSKIDSQVSKHPTMLGCRRRTWQKDTIYPHVLQ